MKLGVNKDEALGQYEREQMAALMTLSSHGMGREWRARRHKFRLEASGEEYEVSEAKLTGNHLQWNCYDDEVSEFEIDASGTREKKKVSALESSLPDKFQATDCPAAVGPSVLLGQVQVAVTLDLPKQGSAPGWHGNSSRQRAPVLPRLPHG